MGEGPTREIGPDPLAEGSMDDEEGAEPEADEDVIEDGA